MKVYPVIPRGYCKGVVRAIQLALDACEQYQNQPIYILGMIVHNQYIVDALEAKGIHTIAKPNCTRLQLLDEINEGVVLISAHGASEAVFNKAKEKGLKVIDATCIDVIKTHDLIKEQIKHGYEVLYIGKKGHPESEGTISIDPTHIHLVTSREDILAFKDQTTPFFITNQTTMSLWDVFDLCEFAKENLNKVTLQQETCQATTIRQEAIAHLPQDIDGLIIVGDPHSNNTTRLAEIGKTMAHKDVLMIDSIEDLDLTWLNDKTYVAVSSGASTPTALTNQVISFLKDYDGTQALPTVALDQILM